MSDIINLLPDSVANQIAAGEVVDRPASAVKELLENAIDAGATQIQLIVKDAGRTLFQVIDNGCGMSENDARLCFERHATSKIHRADDLFAIHTMGFRGEALASIAAVAQVELHSCTHEGELGTCVCIEGSDVRDQLPCHCAKGTSIAVKNLFYNIPARRNFLKKDSVELSHIDEIFRRVALVNYQIGFTFHNNGKLLYDLRPGNMAQRIAGIFGANYKERIFPVEEKTEVVCVHGYVCKPEYVRRTRGEQYLFVNGRFIKHPAINAAIERAYADMIPERCYPSYFLCLEVDPSRIDVNIHPAKTEVRFEDEHALFAIIRAATKRSLGQFSLATEIEFNPSTEIDFSPVPQNYTPAEPHISYDPNYNPFVSTRPSIPSSPSKANTTLDANFFGSTRKEHMMGEREQMQRSKRSQWETFFDTPHAPDNSDYPSNGSQELQTDLTSPDSPSTMSSPTGSIGITDPQDDESPSYLTTTPSTLSLQGRYIVTTLKSGLVIIDHQRAHERIIFEKLMAQAAANRSVGAQQLLFPVSCSFSPADSELLAELLPDLRKMGFGIDPLGQCTFVVTATPCDVEECDLQGLLDNLIRDYKSDMIEKFSERDRTLCSTLARQMAIRKGRILKPEEIQNIIAELFSCQVPNVSPSGKRTMIILNDIEDRFN